MRNLFLAIVAVVLLAADASAYGLGGGKLLDRLRARRGYGNQSQTTVVVAQTQTAVVPVQAVQTRTVVVQTRARSGYGARRGAGACAACR